MGIITPSWATSYYQVTLSTVPGAYLHDYAYSEKGRLYWRISSLYVPPALRRQRVAHRLMETITAQADEAGAFVNLTAEPGGRSLKVSALKRFYQRFGFIQIPERICSDKQYMERAPSPH